jgi:hypothetical protein
VLPSTATAAAVHATHLRSPAGLLRWLLVNEPLPLLLLRATPHGGACYVCHASLMRAPRQRKTEECLSEEADLARPSAVQDNLHVFARSRLASGTDIQLVYMSSRLSDPLHIFLESSCDA